MRTRVAVGMVLSFALVAVLSLTASGQSSAPGSPGPEPSYPDSIVVIGHSGATGYDSDPQRPGVDVDANSWATGTNPDVNSVYLQVLAHNPAVAGNRFNLAIDGSDVNSLVDQAHQAVALTPAPELVLVQSIDNDIQCDGSDEANYEPYRSKLIEVLDTLSTGLPKARIFFVDQWADVATYDRAAFVVDPEHIMGTGPCDTVDPGTKQIVPTKEAYLQGLIDDYFGIITEVCSKYPTCRTDGGAMQRLDLLPSDFSADMNHLSIAGHAKMAQIAFDSLYGTP